jgi:hypothetical protein
MSARMSSGQSMHTFCLIGLLDQRKSGLSALLLTLLNLPPFWITMRASARTYVCACAWFVIWWALAIVWVGTQATRVNLAGILGGLGQLPGVPTPALLAIGKVLCQGITADPSFEVVAEALNSIFDVFAEPNANEVCLSNFKFACHSKIQLLCLSYFELGFFHSCGRRLCLSYHTCMPFQHAVSRFG